ncbi:MAG: hypothetical protein WC509_02360 [Candidatus Izemoplasmatales bacterium]
MVRWTKRFRDGYAAACPTPYLLDDIKSRLAFSSQSPRRGRALLVALTSLQAFLGSFLVLLGGALIDGASREFFPLVIPAMLGILRYDTRDLRLGIALFVIGIVLLAIDAVFIWRYVARRRGEQR